MTTRTRICPSPTGTPHVGLIRTMLYNWAYARHNGGTLVFRIEDTDAARDSEDSYHAMLDSLRWLGLDWDEGPEVGGPFGPYREAERVDLCREAADRFGGRGAAYFCYCTPAELEDRRRAALARGQTPGYDGRCRNLTEQEREAFDREGRPKAIRFAMPGIDMTVHDLIRGDTRFPANDLRDFVIMRSDGTPTYLLAAAVDDVEMKMTHVIRGEDLLPSTPRQLKLIEAMGAQPPAYAHLPLVVGPDRQPLSKRHGSVAVEWFREQGILPEALVNYLALLGWSYDERTTILSREQLIEAFDLSRVSHNPAAFDAEKLRWLNGHYIRQAADSRLTELLAEELLHQGVEADLQTIARGVPLVKERMHTIVEGAQLLRFLFEEVAPDEKAAKFLGPEEAEYLREVADRLEALPEWTRERIEEALRAI